ncbi:MAG: class I SAM-dependent methyltransferase family protein [Methanobacteriaceae archaeon]|jgi:tRNA wybutosine-synthesizing protein 2|nr:class I SAM-dependent methyltransferase family protein [Candidatus Methanorudis spinitermitis]
MKWKKIGNILILDKNSKYESEKDLKRLLDIHNVETIVKVKNIAGQFRTPSVEILIGNNTETIHKENGCLFKLDVSKVMWSKGNTNERFRIAKLVKSGDTIVDMFAGIGYFSIPIARHSQPKKIFSIEINPDSYHYLKNNIDLNKINIKAGYKRIEAILEDCKKIATELSADRVLMGYVKTTHHFLDVAIDCVNHGGIIHYHETVPEKLMNSRPYERIAKSAGNREVEILDTNIIKKYSPGVVHIVVDARIY